MQKLFLSVLCLFSFSSFAGFLIDPYVGLGSQKTTLDALSGNIDDTETSTFLGARAGYSFLMFSAGLDYQIMKDDSQDITNMSLFAGVDLPILVRGWAEYFINSDYENDSFSSVDFDKGYGVGIGLTMLPFVSINIEAQYLTYEADSALGNNMELESAAYLLSVSLPLDL